MRLVELIAVMEKIAPTRFAESWDNVGLLVGDPSQEIARGMLTIDYTTAVAREAFGGPQATVLQGSAKTASLTAGSR